MSEFSIVLPDVLDCRDVSAMGLGPSDLLHDADWDVPQELAIAALGQVAKGMLVPSATLLGDNLIILPDNLAHSGKYEVRALHSRAMRPHVGPRD